MHFPVPLIRCLIITGAAAGATGSLHAQLAAKSPFMPSQGAASASPTASAPLQYVGYMETKEGRLYRIYDPVKKTSTWVKPNERNQDFDVTAKQFDEGQNTLTIEYQGKTLTLAGRESKVVSSGNAGQMMPPPTAAPGPASNVSPAVTQAVVLNPTAADEQRRLDAVAAEVARRRALREQATQQMNQGAPQTLPAPAAPPQQSFPAAPPPQNNQNMRGRGPTGAYQQR